MSFYRQLVAATEQPRQQLLDAPIIGRALAGTITRDDYLAFLGQAFHHVKQTTPLLMAVGSRLPDDKEWLRAACTEYIEEEIGHHEWILNDIAALGGDREEYRHSLPLPATELMVAYAWDMVTRISPLGFFGMVLVLEGTSIALADRAAETIQRSLDLPANAFSYLRSHGALDQEHVRFYEGLMDRIVDPAEQRLITHAATMFYRLYGDIFRAIG